MKLAAVVALVALVTVALGATRARAEPPRATESRVTFEVVAPAGCDAEAIVDRELDRLLGDARRTGEPLSAHVEISARASDELELELVLAGSGVESKRVVAGKSCETLAEVAALLIAVSHDPDAVERASAEPQTGPAPRIEVPTPQPVEPRDLRVKPLDPSELVEPGAPLRPLAPTLDLGFTARAGMLAGIGDLPGPHLGAEAGIGLRIDEYEVSLTFEYAGGATARLTSRPDAGADFERIAGIARACRDLYPWSARPSAGAPFSLPLRADRGPFAVTVGACLGVELGEMAGQGFGVTYPERGEAFWAAPRFDVRGALNLVGPLSLSLDVGVAFPLDPRRFIITAADQSVLVVYTPAPAAGRLGLALQLDL